MNKSGLHLVFVLVVLAITYFFACNGKYPQNFSEFWQTRNQQGQRAMTEGEFSKAAELFNDPMRKGIAYYRNGQFKKAAQSFNQLVTVEALYNKGNSLIMMGKYKLAIKSYNQVLAAKSDHKPAKLNREIARIRQQFLDKSQEDEHPGNELEADEIVFDKKTSTNGNDDDAREEIQSEKAINALWLRRVQTRPGDFLKIKFSYQLQKRESSK